MSMLYICTSVHLAGKKKGNERYMCWNTEFNFICISFQDKKGNSISAITLFL